MVIVWLISLVVMGVNVYFIIDQVVSENSTLCDYTLFCCCCLQVLRGPLYQHILGAIGLVAYLAIVGFFVSFYTLATQLVFMKQF